MAFTIVDENDTQSITTKDIIAAGQRVGQVRINSEKSPIRYHVILTVSNGDRFRAGLAQGHGYSLEDALKDTFITSRSDAREYLENLDLLERQLMDL